MRRSWLRMHLASVSVFRVHEEYIPMQDILFLGDQTEIWIHQQLAPGVLVQYTLRSFFFYPICIGKDG